MGTTGKSKGQSRSPRKATAYTPIVFTDVKRQASELAAHIRKHHEKLVDILLAYESFEVAEDEIGRTLDLLEHLSENKDYFRLRIGAVTAFLPRNQPLYALSCFVLVPALMASEVHFRIPHAMRDFFPGLLDALQIEKRFPNVHVSGKERNDFLRERSALRVNPKTQESWPVTDAVIFTGTSAHADQLRIIFDQRTLFITNGSGHNPIIVSSDADIDLAVDAVLTLTLYNQGQDCAAPNAILVHADVYDQFLTKLRKELANQCVGHYRDRTCRVGPISDPKDLVRIQDFLIENRAWLDQSTPGLIDPREAILQPTIVTKPLKEGVNFNEIFAPVIFVQRYESDGDLKTYFESPHYARNAMYVTVYGTSAYADTLAGRQIDGKVLHDAASVKHNIHLHASGVERGTQPYGGYGYGASSLSINGTILPRPTLPQRDIFEWVAKPLLKHGALAKHRESQRRLSSIVEKDLRKLMKLRALEESKPHEETLTDLAYVDLEGIKPNGKRYYQLPKDAVTHLLRRPNRDYIGQLDLRDLQLLRVLRRVIVDRSITDPEEFKAWLYALPKDHTKGESENRERQLQFFTHVYRLLLGADAGPRLARFLLDIDPEKAGELLDV